MHIERLAIGSARTTLGHLEIFGFANTDPEHNGIDQRHRRQQRAFAAPNQITGLHLGYADDTVDRRADGGVAEIERRQVILGDGGIARRDSIVELLPTDRLLRIQRLEAFDIAARFGQPRLHVGEISLQRLGVDLVQQRAFFNVRTFGEIDGLQKAFDPRANFDVLLALRLANQVHIHRHIALQRLDHNDGGNRRGFGWGFTAGDDADAEAQGHHQFCKLGCGVAARDD